MSAECGKSFTSICGGNRCRSGHYPTLTGVLCEQAFRSGGSIRGAPPSQTLLELVIPLSLFNPKPRLPFPHPHEFLVILQLFILRPPI